MTDEPMPNKPIYDEWIASRRAAEPSSDLTDRVMAAIEERNTLRKHYVRLADRINESQPARWAACVAAMLVGSLPFLYVAHVAQMLVL